MSVRKLLSSTSLSHSFVAASGIALASGCTLPIEIPGSNESLCDSDLTDMRPLTDGEDAYLHDYLGLETSGIILGLCPNPPAEKYGSTGELETLASTTGRNGLTVFYDPELLAADFTAAKPTALGVFTHEMTHHLQWREKGALHSIVDNSDVYDYTLSPRSRFDSGFNDEQESSITADFAVHFLTQKQGRTKRFINASLQGEDSPATDALLIKVVEDRFSGAQSMRLEARGEAPPTPRGYTLPIAPPKK